MFEQEADKTNRSATRSLGLEWGWVELPRTSIPISMHEEAMKLANDLRCTWWRVGRLNGIDGLLCLV
jgi:hypothetical protein